VVVVVVLLGGHLLVAKLTLEDGDRLLAVDLEPVCADQVMLVEHRVVRAEEPEVLKLKEKKENAG
jgi:hypothetical protein